ncbi:MAG: hypothetical protein IJA84_03735 [Clostridia bacterium]|nr:hypothetical protein [Clostridia bacterium]
MKSIDIFASIGNLDESLLTEALPKKRRNFRPLAVVAAVAAALAVTAGAAHLIAPEVFFTGSGVEKQIATRTEFGGTAFAPGVVEDLMEMQRRYRASDNIEELFMDFDTMAELETYLGVPLLKDPARQERGCFLTALCKYSNEVREDGMLVTVNYNPQDWRSNLSDFRLYAEVAPCVSATTMYTDAPMEVPDITCYEVEALGVTATVVKGMYNSLSTVATFVKDGVSYEVECICSMERMCAFLETLTY